MWERFSYYGMRALLILFMTAPPAAGGLGLRHRRRPAPIYGLYTSMVYMTSLPGGWIADRLIGQRRAVLYGGILIACGHFSMAVPVAGDLLPRPRADRARHRPAQRQHQRHRRPAVRDRAISGATPASRSSTWGSTSARSSRRWSAATSGSASTGTSGFARGRRRHDARPRAVRARRAATSATPACIPRSRLARSAATQTHAAVVGRRRRSCWCCSARRSPPASCPSRPTQIADAAGYVAPRRHGRLLRLAVLSSATGRRVERRRLYVIGVFFLAAALFWSRVRAGRIDAEPVRRSRHAQRRSSAGASRAAGSSRCNALFIITLRAGVRVAVGAARRRASRRARRSSRSACCCVGRRLRRARSVAATCAANGVQGQPEVADRRPTCFTRSASCRSARSA